MQLSCSNRKITFNGFHCNRDRLSSSLIKAVAVVPVRRQEPLRLRAVTDCRPELLEMEEWREMLKWGDKCGGSSSGVVELLECLEREAIMGEDEGREPVDYNRRAQIFDKSARVFQALKHQADDDDDDEDTVHCQK
ncbi:hypothetical protein QQ045_029845 [Rhodiola kirilowii]